MEDSTVVLLPCQPASVAVARHRITSEMRFAGTQDGAIDDAALVITELLTNAIRHASPLSGRWLQVTWALLNESVEIAVSDGGSTTLPRVSRPALSALGGRGLEIVQKLSMQWGVRSSGPGTTVWAVLDAPCLRANDHLPA